MQISYDRPALPDTWEFRECDFILRIADLVYLTREDKDTDNIKTEHCLYDLKRGEWRNDLVPWGSSPYRGLTDQQLIEIAAGL